jgi:hypothetical protein
MLTKIGVTALLGALGTAAVGGGTAAANEPCRTVAPVTIAAPVAIPVAYRTPVAIPVGYQTTGIHYRYRNDRREEMARLQRQRRAEAMRHAAWLHQHHGGFGGGWRR